MGNQENGEVMNPKDNAGANQPKESLAKKVKAKARAIYCKVDANPIGHAGIKLVKAGRNVLAVYGSYKILKKLFSKPEVVIMTDGEEPDVPEEELLEENNEEVEEVTEE